MLIETSEGVLISKPQITKGFSILSDQHIHTDIDVHYVDHAKRVASAEYRKTHTHMIEELDLPCFVCGIRYSKGGAVETHHFFIEYAAINTVDWEVFKFTAEKESFKNPQTGVLLSSASNWGSIIKDPGSFTDGETNCVAICSVHHRSTKLGIHSLPYPIWSMLRFTQGNNLVT